MKKYIIIVFLLLASASYAQPVIDHMLVDEAKGELNIFGTFGVNQGKVWIDSVLMQIKSWSDSLVVTAIPDTGKSSAGGVIVGSMGYQSEARMLTAWELKIFYMSSLLHSLGPEGTKAYFTLNWRLDLHSYLKNGKVSDFLSFDGIYSSNTSQGHYTSYLDLQKHQPVYDSTKYVDSSYSYTGYFYPSQHRIDFDIKLNVYDVIPGFGHGGFESYCHFDSLFKLLSLDTAVGIAASAGWRQMNTPIELAFPPPSKAIALQNNPSIVNPGNHSIGIGTDNVILRWNALALMEQYHLQVSLDSSFNNARLNHPQIQGVHSIVDTIIADTTFTLPPLSKNTKYFWSVAGVNSEGESRWSDVWNFWTGLTSADVRDAQKSIFTFSAYPNPAADKLNISYTSPNGEVNIALYDLLGNKVRSLIQKGDEGGIVELSLLGLTNGEYFLELRSGGVHKSMPISILR